MLYIYRIETSITFIFDMFMMRFGISRYNIS